MLFFLRLLLSVSTKSAKKNGRVPEWNGLHKYNPSTLTGGRHVKGRSVLTSCHFMIWEQFAVKSSSKKKQPPLSHINQPKWHVYKPREESFCWPLLDLNSDKKTLGLTVAVLFFGSLLIGLFIHYPLNVWNRHFWLAVSLPLYLSDTLWSRLVSWKTSQRCDQRVKLDAFKLWGPAHTVWL